MAAEAERVAHCNPHVAFLGRVQREVDTCVDIGVAVEIVDGGRNHPFGNRHDAGEGLYCTGGTQQVARHGFRRTEVRLVYPVAYGALYAYQFRYVTRGGGGTVRIDVVHLVGRYPGLLHRILHCVFCAQSFRVGGGEVVGVGAHAAAALRAEDHAAADAHQKAKTVDDVPDRSDDRQCRRSLRPVVLAE